MARRYALVLALLLAPSLGFGQTIGTFRWQLQSYCNVLSLVVTQNGGVFTLDGFDDQCGAATRAPATGLATFNPNGTIEFGLTIVATPGGVPVNVAAAINLATLGGTWRDSAGGSGDLVFTPGAGTGGSPRPPVATSLAPGSVTSAHLAPGSVTGAHVLSSEVQRRVSGSCALAESIVGVSEDGSVACSPTLSLSTFSPLEGTFNNGLLMLGLKRTANFALDLSGPDGFVASGILGGGQIPTTGPGIRFMWFPRKSAIRAGGVSGAQWDNANVGSNSVAMGADTVAAGDFGTAFGALTSAAGNASLAVGQTTLASGAQSVALGAGTTASGAQALAMGFQSQAGGTASVALGTRAVTTAPGAFVFADQSGNDAFTSPAPNEFGVRAAGGVYLYTSANLSTGCSLSAGSGAWACTSDRNSKDHFEPIDGELVLTRLRSMPIERWSYRSERGVSHVGPVAQDFYAAFELGRDDKTVGHLDLSGIALRAIQALEARTQALMEENAALRARLEQLEAKRP